MIKAIGKDCVWSSKGKALFVSFADNPQTLSMKILLRVSAVLLALLATSCLTITEDYTFASNGSGSLSYTIDMSQLAQFMQMAQSQEDGNSSMKEMSFKKFEEPLKKIKGISKIKVNDDMNKFIFNITFAFASLTNLNEALGVLMSSTEGGSTSSAAFEMQGDQLVCVHSGGDQSQALMNQLGAGDDGEQAMAIMQSMKYNINMNFKKPVEAVISAGSVTYDNTGKTVHLSTDFASLVASPEALSANVILK
jgi:hypothetical protein